MYERWWDLDEPAFLNNFERRFFVGSSRTDESIARIHFLVDQRRQCGIVKGPAGIGKSFQIRTALQQLSAPLPKIAIVDVAGLPYENVLRDLATALHATIGDTDSEFIVWRSIIDQLVGGRLIDNPTVIVFDHVDQAGTGALQVIERLLNLQSSVEGGYTVIVSCCQATSSVIPQSADLTIRIAAMNETETIEYVNGRLQTAGRPADKDDIFGVSALQAIYKHSHGVPRRVNRLCEMSMLMAVSRQQQVVTAEQIDEAAAEIFSGDAAA